MKDVYRIYLSLFAGAVLIELILKGIGVMIIKDGLGAVGAFIVIWLGLRIAYSFGAEIKKKI